MTHSASVTPRLAQSARNIHINATHCEIALERNRHVVEGVEWTTWCVSQSPPRSELEQLVAVYGAPSFPRSDNGPELIAKTEHQPALS
jgi:hypothetical protein